MLPHPYGCKAYAFLANRDERFAFYAPKPDLSVLRQGDVVISSGIKSGTTFTRALVQQIIAKGVDDFTDLTDEVPFIQFYHHPYETDAAKLRHFEALTWSRRPVRAIATHDRTLPLDPTLKYIVTFRSPHEVHDSYRAFFNSMHDDMRALWSGCVPSRVSEDAFEYMWSAYLAQHIVANHVNAWWPHRHAPNVLFLHYADMNKDLTATARRVAAFMGVALAPDELAAVVEHTSFAFMKAHASRYDGSPQGWPRPFIERGWIKPGFQAYESEALTRSGKTGQHDTSERMAKYAAALDKQIPDEQARTWVLHGGPLPAS